MMYSKRVFTLLTTLFIAFVLTACGGGGGYGDSSSGGKKDLTSVYEFDHFPKFNETANTIKHTIQRSYKTETEQNNDIKAFEDKGGVKVSQGLFLISNPYSAVTQASVGQTTFYQQGYYLNTMELEISGDSIDRNNTLLKEIFGYKEGTLVSVDVQKFFEKDITLQLKQYGALLEKDYGFKKSSTIEWTKDDTENNGLLYTFTYTDATTVPIYPTGKKILQSAVWHVGSTKE
jgi:hypothetical protein